MTTPVLLVAGFLGAGKTTLVNGLLRDPGGRRIAAVVNDFGALDVDAALLGASTDGVVSLPNGCICCSLQGDLLRTLATLVRRRPAPDAIVIETSGASDPGPIVRSLLDPVVFAVTPLDTVATVVDARHAADRPTLVEDPLWRAQLRAADFVVVGKTDLVDASELDAVRAAVARCKPGRLTFDAVAGAVPSTLLFSQGDHAPLQGPARRSAPSADRFEAIAWIAKGPLSPERFQAAIGRLSPRLLRAKGFVTFEGRPDRPMLVQLVGARATVVAAPPSPGGLPNGLVLIAEAGALDEGEARAILDLALSPSPGSGLADLKTGMG